VTNTENKPREFDFSLIEYHACLWGDCHHNKQLECFKAVAEEQFNTDKEFYDSEIKRLEEKLGIAKWTLGRVQRHGLHHHEDCKNIEYDNQDCTCGMEQAEKDILSALEKIKET